MAASGRLLRGWFRKELTKHTEGWGGRSWQTTCTCKGGEEEPAWEQCGWTEACRSGSQEVTFHIFQGCTDNDKWLKFIRCLQQTCHSASHGLHHFIFTIALEGWYHCDSHVTDGETAAERAR